MATRPPKVTDKKATAGEWRQAFLSAMRTLPVVRVACQAAGISRKTAYQWKLADPDFAADWEEAQNDGIDMLEIALHKRAREMDTTAAIFLLKCLRPDRFRDRQQIEHSGQITHVRPDIPDSELDARIEQQRRALEGSGSVH